MAKELHFPFEECRLGWAGHKLVVFEGFQDPPNVIRVALNQLLNRLSISPDNDVVNVLMCVRDVEECPLHHSLKLATSIIHNKDQHIPLHGSLWVDMQVIGRCSGFLGICRKPSTSSNLEPSYFCLGVENVLNSWQGMSAFEGRII